MFNNYPRILMNGKLLELLLIFVSRIGSFRFVHNCTFALKNRYGEDNRQCYGCFEVMIQRKQKIIVRLHSINFRS